MIIYNVTVNVENGCHDEWLNWMQHVHIPEVMACGIFTGHRILKVLADEDSGGKTYAIQYNCNSMEDYDTYIKNFAPALRQKTISLFGEKVVAFRTLLETL
jgi:hypothetical protein